MTWSLAPRLWSSSTRASGFGCPRFLCKRCTVQLLRFSEPSGAWQDIQWAPSAHRLQIHSPIAEQDQGPWRQLQLRLQVQAGSPQGRKCDGQIQMPSLPEDNRCAAHRIVLTTQLAWRPSLEGYLWASSQVSTIHLVQGRRSQTCIDGGQSNSEASPWRLLHASSELSQAARCERGVRCQLPPCRPSQQTSDGKRGAACASSRARAAGCRTWLQGFASGSTNDRRAPARLRPASRCEALKMSWRSCRSKF